MNKRTFQNTFKYRLPATGKANRGGSMETYHLNLNYNQLIQKDFTESGIRNSKIFRQ